MAGTFFGQDTYKITRSARTSNTILGINDKNTLIDVTSGTFTQTFMAAATIQSGWFVYYRNSGTGDITLDPDGAETIDGLTTFIVYPSETRLIQCTGTEFISIVLSPFYKTFTSTDTFTKPPGYPYFGGLMWSGGASGQRTNNVGVLSVGGGAGGCFPFSLLASIVGATETITIGAGGAAVTTVAFGNIGNNTSFGSLLTVFANGSFNLGGAVGITSIFGSAYDAYPSTGFGYNNSGATPVDAVYGGGASSTNATVASSSSIYGGGGGGSVDAIGALRAAGTSKFGGAGGAASIASNGTAGTAPAGGGGATQTGTASGAGARGEVRIWGIA